MRSEDIMNYFTFYYVSSEAKHIFMSPSFRKSNQEKQMLRLMLRLTGCYLTKTKTKTKTLCDSYVHTVDCSGLSRQTTGGFKLSPNSKESICANRVNNGIFPTNYVHMQIPCFTSRFTANVFQLDIPMIQAHSN